MTTSFHLANEFAAVSVTVVGTARRRVLEITAEQTGRSIRLDALELQALAGITHRDLDAFVLRTTQARNDLGTPDVD